MKGLILKDIYQLKSCTRVFLVIILFCAVLGFGGNGAVFFTYYPCVMMGMLPMTLYAYDEQAKFHYMLAGLPVKRSSYVSAKYLMGFVLVLIAYIAVGIVQCVKMMGTGSFVLVDFLLVMTSVMAIGLLAPAIALPFIFLFGVEKGRYVNIFLIVGCSTIISIGMAVERDFQLTISAGTLAAVMLVAAFAVYGLSWWISARIFEKKEF